MDWVNISERIRTAGKKYKYVALVLFLGILLMSLPDRQESGEISETVEHVTEEISVSESLEHILSQIEGVGKVKVLLTEDRGSEIIYQIDEDTASSEGSSSQRTETVIISDTDRVQNGLIRQTIPPSYRGALVVCQGAERPSVQLAIVEAVANVTGISADRITVLKMK